MDGFKMVQHGLWSNQTVSSVYSVHLRPPRVYFKENMSIVTKSSLTNPSQTDAAKTVQLEYLRLCETPFIYVNVNVRKCQRNVHDLMRRRQCDSGQML